MTRAANFSRCSAINSDLAEAGASPILWAMENEQ
jgi:hypothetical protein